MDDILATVIEHPHYIAKAKKLLTEEQMREIVNMLALDPYKGDVLIGTGGVRKFRFAAVNNKGKSGGMRVLYLYVSKKGKVHLLDIFGKSDKDNLTQSERNRFLKLSVTLKGLAG